jgi:putative transposase
MRFPRPARAYRIGVLLRMDNGPEIPPTPCATGAASAEPSAASSSRGSPWQNPFVESFGSRVRDEVLSVEAFDSVIEAQTVIND